MSSLQVGQLIFISLKPILKLSIPTLAGFFLTRAGLFPTAGSKAASQIILNCTLPALLFSKIIPSFTSQNISAIVPIFICAFSYIGISFFFGLIIRSMFRPPDRFRSGFIFAVTFSNWGDLPVAVASTITLSAPFTGGSTDADLAIAYISIFIIVFFVTVFPLQGYQFISRDYTHPYHSPSSPTSPTLFTQFSSRLRRRLNRTVSDDEGTLTEETIGMSDDSGAGGKEFEPVTSTRSRVSIRELSTLGAAAVDDIRPFPRRNRSSVTIRGTEMEMEKEREDYLSIHDTAGEGIITRLQRFRSFLSTLFTPPSIALLAALVIALTPKLKALFYYDATVVFNPKAPDGAPVLGVILDGAEFLGVASVPLGLIVLGSALGRMRLPKPLSKLPMGSIVAVAVAKLVLLPLIGYSMVKALVNHTNLIGPDQKVLQFVCIYFSVMPSATTQVALTQIYSEDQESNEDILAGYLIFQYIVFLISSTVVTAILLRSLS